MKEVEKESLIRKIQQLEEITPPPELTQNIMSKICSKKRSYWQRFFEFVTTPQPLNLRPISLLATSCVLAITFGLGMLANSPNESKSVEAQKIQLTENAINGAEASFQIGKGLLQAGLVSEALPFLDKASRSKPGNSEYAYWQGLCYFADGKPEVEQASYLRGLESSPKSVPLLLNLGHSLLEQRKPEAALQQYKQVIAINPKQQAALYNQTLIYRLLQDESSEKNALKTYLDNHRIGSRTFRAVHRLNDLNDFSYRSYQLGRQKVILSQGALLEDRLSNRFEYETELLSSKLRHNPHLLIDIVIFIDANETKAKNRAKLIRDSVVAKLDSTDKKRIRLSWFGEAETIKMQTENHHLQEGILLFGQVKKNAKEGTEI